MVYKKAKQNKTKGPKKEKKVLNGKSWTPDL